MEPQPKSNLGMIIGLTVLASAIVFGGLGYYLATMGSDTDTTTTTTATPTSAVTATATTKPTSSASATPATTDTWKTYTNTTFNYSFKYPDTGGWKTYTVEPNDGTFVGLCRATACQDARDYIQISSESLETVVNQDVALNKNKENYEKKSITFLGMAATQITFSTTHEGDTDVSKYVYFSKGGKTYTIAGTVSSEYMPEDGIYEAFLSTFKFN